MAKRCQTESFISRAICNNKGQIRELSKQQSGIRNEIKGS